MRGNRGTQLDWPGAAVAAWAARPGGSIVKPLPADEFDVHGLNAEMRWEVMQDRGYVVPNECFFVRNHTATPLIDAETWSLPVFGTGPGRPARHRGPPASRLRARPATGAMSRHAGDRDAPANNLMARSRSACPVAGPWNCRFPPEAGGPAAFPWLPHDREGSYPRSGGKFLRDHEVPAQAPRPAVTSASAGSFSPRSGRLHS
jgi:hypothetical protein